jgi:hypothetical protein
VLFFLSFSFASFLLSFSPFFHFFLLPPPLFILISLPFGTATLSRSASQSGNLFDTAVRICQLIEQDQADSQTGLYCILAPAFTCHHWWSSCYGSERWQYEANALLPFSNFFHSTDWDPAFRMRGLFLHSKTGDVQNRRTTQSTFIT